MKITLDSSRLHADTFIYSELCIESHTNLHDRKDVIARFKLPLKTTAFVSVDIYMQVKYKCIFILLT